ncbi:MAG: carboxyvinyl-carboxyphosphonate phosphorylmutase, partial [Pseudomonadota bacterium]|nr:carboxyvinyl-carboxyphosphonate phosphorylmutase [Pseudomonadota bacterium]
TITEQLGALCRRFAARIPLLANMVEGGSTPLSDAAALERLGFSIAIFPGGTVRAVARTMQAYFASLAEHGTTAPFLGRMLDFREINGVVGTDALLEEGTRYAG